MADETELDRMRRAAPTFGLFAPPPIDAEMPKARREDPATSHTAANNPGVKVRANTAKAKLLATHRLFPAGLTDREAAYHAGLSLGSEYATRCSELVRLGLLADTDETRPDPDTKQSRLVRRITALGLRALDHSPSKEASDAGLG